MILYPIRLRASFAFYWEASGDARADEGQRRDLISHCLVIAETASEDVKSEAYLGFGSVFRIFVGIILLRIFVELL